MPELGSLAAPHGWVVTDESQTRPAQTRDWTDGTKAGTRLLVGLAGVTDIQPQVGGPPAPRLTQLSPARARAAPLGVECLRVGATAVVFISRLRSPVTERHFGRPCSR